MDKKMKPLLLLLAILMSFVYLSKVNAQEPVTVLKIESPAEVGPPGQNFTISIIAENIPEDNRMFGWEIVIRWTPGLINCTGETLNYNIWGAGNFLGPWVTQPIDNVNGKYWQSLTGKVPGTPVSGTYWLVNLTFIVIGEPCNNVPFSFELPPGYTAYCLLNADAEEIPHQYQPATPHIMPEFNSIFIIFTAIVAFTAPIAARRYLKKKN